MYKELAIRAENPYSKKLGILIVDYDEEREPFGEYLRPRFKNRFKIMVIIYGYWFLNSKRSIGYDLAREPTYTMIMIAYFVCIITIVGMIIAICVMYLRGKKIEGENYSNT